MRSETRRRTAKEPAQIPQSAVMQGWAAVGATWLTTVTMVAAAAASGSSAPSTAPTSLPDPLASNPIDTIDFGCPEPRHNAQLANCTLAPAADGPHGGDAGLIFDPLRGGSIRFTMAVDPVEQTHLTVRFWGGATLINGSVLTAQQNTWLLNPLTNFTQWGASHEWPCEFDQFDPSRSIAGSGAFPNRWQYVTYPLPRDWTANRTELELGLGTGGFAWYSGPAYYPSRPIYRGYTHVAPYVSVDPDESRGVKVPPDAPARGGLPPAVLSASVAAELAAAVQHLFDAQLWSWADVGAGTVPRCLFGAPTVTGLRCPLLPNGTANASACKAAWQSYDDSGNLPFSTAVMAMGAAYNSTARWAANFTGQRWVLERVAGALDVHVRAQGSNGGFISASGPPGWVGGPNRSTAGDPLEGWGHVGIARGFALAYRGLVNEGLLDVAIDDDDNSSTPNITRENAYLNLFRGSRQYLLGTGATFCPNQELGDAKGIWAANAAVRLLAPAEGWPEELVLQQVVLPTVGLANFSDRMWHAKISKFPRPPGNWVTISPVGISLEAIGSLAGGYSGGYSDTLDAIDRWADWAAAAGELRTHSALADVLQRMATAFAHFRLVGNCVDVPTEPNDPPPPAYRCLRNQGYITWRNNVNPGEAHTPFAPHTALVLRNPTYIRELQLHLQYAGNSSLFAGRPGQDAHWVSELINALPLAEHLDALLALPPSTTRLPLEPGTGDFGWADNVGRSVVARYGEDVIFATLQWRHDTNHTTPFAPSVGLPVTANGVCRVELVERNQTRMRLANAGCFPESGGPLTTVHSLFFGPWLVGMNSNLYSGLPFRIPTACVGRSGVELVSGKTIPSLPAVWPLAANQTVVVRLTGEVAGAVAQL